FLAADVASAVDIREATLVLGKNLCQFTATTATFVPRESLWLHSSDVCKLRSQKALPFTLNFSLAKPNAAIHLASTQAKKALGLLVETSDGGVLLRGSIAYTQHEPVTRLS